VRRDDDVGLGMAALAGILWPAGIAMAIVYSGDAQPRKAFQCLVLAVVHGLWMGSSAAVLSSRSLDSSGSIGTVLRALTFVSWLLMPFVEAACLWRLPFPLGESAKRRTFRARKPAR
jgi:hypothetical protein